MKVFLAGLIGSIGALLNSCSPPVIVANIRCERADGKLPRPGDCAEADKVFNKAVQRRFPVGSSESALKRELIAEGFTPGPVPRRYDGSACWKFDPICLKLLTVDWTTDKSGKITFVEGHYVVGSL